jgi:hypothetical protein
MKKLLKIYIRSSDRVNVFNVRGRGSKSEWNKLKMSSLDSHYY